VSSPEAVAVVTGAGSGIGRQVALSLLGAGYRVVLAGRRREALDAVRSQAGPPAASALVVPTDVRDQASVRALFATVSDAYDVGNAATDLTAAMRQGVLQADGSYAAEPTIDVEHVASAVLYMASLPLDANVQFLTIMATAMPFIGRG
jgi:NADP-dependent 3-hydroxy acid dehydrogenase YdfG